MKKFKINKNIFYKQLFLCVVIGIYKVSYSGHFAYSVPKKDAHYYDNFPKSLYFDLFSMCKIKIFSRDNEIEIFKNIGLISTREILDCDLWTGQYSGNISDIEDIVLEAEKDAVPDFWNESNENDMFVPRCIFFKMRNGVKICIAVIYRLKFAQEIVAQLKHDILGKKIEYYETTTNFVEKLEATEGKAEPIENTERKVTLLLYNVYEWFGLLLLCLCCLIVIL